MLPNGTAHASIHYVGQYFSVFAEKPMLSQAEYIALGSQQLINWKAGRGCIRIAFHASSCTNCH